MTKSVPSTRALKTFCRAGLATTVWACASLAYAAPLHVDFNNFTYSGSVTRYASLADAQNEVNPTGGPYTIQTAANGPRETRPDARDGQLFVANAAPDYYGTDLALVLTYWSFSTGNPNNTNNGFIQYYYRDSNAPTITGGWQPGYTQFKLALAGGDGDYSDVARFWPAPDSGASNISHGEFVDFNLDVTVSFASPATLNSSTSWYETNDMPSSVTGTLTGIFHNNQTDDAGYNGFYRFNYTLTGPGSWAHDQDPDGTDSIWAAPAAAASIPTLSQWSLAVLAMLIAGLAVWRRRSMA